MLERLAVVMGIRVGRSRAAVLILLLAASCSAQESGAGIDCNPMAYQLDNAVWVMKDGDSRRLSLPGLIGANPSISADGARVAVTSGEPDAGLDLYVASMGTPDQRRLWNGSRR